MRKQDADERKEHEAILETYLHALGMLMTSDDEGPEKDALQVGKNPTCRGTPPTDPRRLES